ncbi:MBL fold metallo-hydrolase [Cupriavidus respiraculi]|uniref:Hydroxyacylglutathione hydrolase n=2 Tax=Cupriavidus respiraculi TaxID=195930 RepID=A0ABN7YU52_9BURK|nr:Hydroxyacylglutathione hydrolase [Cupriavidus respiraculi]
MMATASALALPAGMQVFERGWLSANNVLFVDDGGAALVDSGYVSHAPQTLALVQAGLAGRPLERLINTHLHSDHCGGNALLQRQWAPSTWIPAAEADAVSRWDVDALTYRATGQQCDRFTFDGLLADGAVMRLAGIDWQVIAAPGHDPHAVMLFAPQERLLISGDALWEHGFGVIFPELDGESGFAEQAAVLERIAALDVRLVIPGHGRPFADVGAALERAGGRLAYLRADPLRNASHALKVLVKFKLLEQRRMTRAALLGWMAQAPLMLRIQARYMADRTLAQIADDVIAALDKAGAATRDGDDVVNRD